MSDQLELNADRYGFRFSHRYERERDGNYVFSRKTWEVR
jgi:hypothetical protein